MTKSVVLFCMLTVLFGGTVMADQPAAIPFQPWGGAAISDWQNTAQATVMADMTQGQPAEAFSPTLAAGRWKVIPYEMTDGLKGAMVWCGPESRPPAIRLALNVSGWYAIFVGLFGAPEVPTTAWLRLDGDPAPVRRLNRSAVERGNSEEVFFKVANLTPGMQLYITPQQNGFPQPCGVTHVTLIPLLDSEIARLKADRAEDTKHTMAATFDGFSYYYTHSPRTREELLAAIEIYRDTDFKTLILHAFGADTVTYPSTVGTMKTGLEGGLPRVGDRYFVESLQSLAQQDINPEKTLIDGAHAMGMQVYVAVRPAGWSYLEPFADFWETSFYRDHPQWRCVDRDGSDVARMSWAVPEVRKHIIDILRERVGFGADGVHIVFNRGFPVVLDEEPARLIFEQRYGLDPRGIDESDSRITEWRRDIVATFMRELRAMLRECEKERNEKNTKKGSDATVSQKPLVLSAMVLGNSRDNLQFGVDVNDLISQGLLDEVYSYKWGFGLKKRTYDVKYFLDACQPKAIPFSISTAAYFAEPYYSLEMICSLFREGVSRVTVCDAEIDDIYQWSIINRFGHVQETLDRYQAISGKEPPRTYHKFHKLGEHIRDGRFGPWWGG